jgi:uncharacterized protein DUF7014/AbiJ-like protein
MDEYSNPYWSAIYKHYTREIGLLDLAGAGKVDALKKFFLEADTADCLDLIDITFHVIDTDIRHQWASEALGEAEQSDEEGFQDANYYGDRHFSNPSLSSLEVTRSPDDAIQELNRRFRAHGIGYEFAGHQLMRVDSLYVHAEIVKPTINLLSNMEFAGASSEFLRAHEHYLHGRKKEAIVEATKAFESTLKTICDLSGWAYQANAGASKLSGIVIEHGLIDTSLQSLLSGVRNTLQDGLPTIRNTRGAHGQGSQPDEVPDYLVAYALHLAATTILMLVEAYNDRRSQTTP